MLPDILYICREGENEELRYSLRSLRFLPHDRVFIVGSAPEWVNHASVVVIPTEQSKFTRHDAWLTKYANARRNVEVGVAALRGPKAILMNDDFFFTAPVEEVLPLRYGTEIDFRRAFKSMKVTASRYVEGEVETLRWCHDQFGRADSYSLHVPFPFNPEAMNHLLSFLPHREPPLHIRSAYGNYMGLGGELLEKDPKISRNMGKRGTIRLNGVVVQENGFGPLPTPYVSTNERSFSSFLVGKQLRALHPCKSPYEL